MLAALPRFPANPARRLTHAVMLLLTIAACGLTYMLKPQAGWTRILTIGLGYLSLVLMALSLLLGTWNLLRIKQPKNPVNIYVRRDIGIWAGLTGLVHVLFGLTVHRGGDIVRYFFARTPRGLEPLTDVFGFSNYTGAAATLILLLLLILSNDLSMRLLRAPLWKWLQRLNYILIILVLAHTFGYQREVQREAIMTVLVSGLIAAIVIAQFTGLIIAFARGTQQTRLTSPARAVAVVVIALTLIACSATFVPVPFLLPRSGDAMQTPLGHPTSEVTTPAGHATLPAHGTPSQHGASVPTATPLPQTAFTPAAVVAVRVNGAQRYQTFEGFGASLTIFEETGVYNRHDPSQPVVTTATREQREAIADLLYRQLGLSRLRVFLEDFEPVNDNADPLTFNPSAFDWSVVDAEVGFAVLAKPYGLRTPWLTYAMEAGEKQAWLRTSPQDCTLNPAMIDEEVEWLLAGALRARQQGMDLRYMTINNEPDLCRPPISKIAVDDYVTIIKRLGPRLRAEGLETMIVVSDGWLPVNAIEYMRAALADPEARPYVGALATHAYDEYSDSGLMMQAAAEGRPPSHAAVEIREQIRDLAAQYNLPVWITEVCYCVPQGRSEFDLVWTRLNHLYDELTITNVSAFDGMNSFFIYRPGVQDEFVNLYFRPDGALDRYEISLYGYLIGHYARYIVPGSVRLDVTSADARVRVVAFERPDGQVALVALNDNPFAVTAEISLSGLSQMPAALSVLASREGALWQSGADIAVDGDVARLVLAPLSVTSLLGKP